MTAVMIFLLIFKRLDEEQRVIVISRVFCDEVFTLSANAVGILSEELLSCLPGFTSHKIQFLQTPL